MTSLLLAIAVLTGPPAPSQSTLALRIHVGSGHESAVIRSELARHDEWFWTRRLRIEANYRLVLVEDLYRHRPCYQIGTGDAPHEFRPGTFSASGTFTRALLSIAENDQFDRRTEFYTSGWAEDPVMVEWDRQRWERLQQQRPEVFPAELPPELPIELPNGEGMP